MLRLIALAFMFSIPATAATVAVLEITNSNPKRVMSVLTDVPASTCDTSNANFCLLDPDLSGIAGKSNWLWCSDAGTIRVCTLAELDAMGQVLDADAMIDAMLTDYCTQINALGASGTVAECRSRVRSAAAE